MSAENTAVIEMPRYRSHKTVWALKIDQVSDSGTDTTTDENQLVTVSFTDPLYFPRTINIGRKPIPEPGWYLVQYADGYVSFSPPKQFEEGNTLEALLNEHLEAKAGYGIGWAVKQMYDGAKMARAGWNGKGMFIFLVPGSQFKVSRHPLLGIYPEGTEIDYRPHVDMRTADGQIVPWVCSQSDLLATDWEQVS